MRQILTALDALRRGCQANRFTIQQWFKEPSQPVLKAIILPHTPGARNAA